MTRRGERPGLGCPGPCGPSEVAGGNPRRRRRRRAKAEGGDHKEGAATLLCGGRCRHRSKHDKTRRVGQRSPRLPPRRPDSRGTWPGPKHRGYLHYALQETGVSHPGRTWVSRLRRLRTQLLLDLARMACACRRARVLSQPCPQSGHYPENHPSGDDLRPSAGGSAHRVHLTLSARRTLFRIRTISEES
jgi:hypothetical protein